MHKGVYSLSLSVLLLSKAKRHISCSDNLEANSRNFILLTGPSAPVLFLVKFKQPLL